MLRRRLMGHLREVEQVRCGRRTLAGAGRHRRHDREILVAHHVVIRAIPVRHALHVVVTVLRDLLRRIAVADDDRAQEHHQIRLLALLRFRSEQLADPRDVAQQRHLAVRHLVVVLHQAAQYDDFAVIGEHGRLDRTDVERRPLRIGRRAHRAADHRRVFGVELKFENPAGGDLRFHVQRQTDVATIVRVEGRAWGSGRQIRVRARRNRHVLPDDDLRLLVVEGDQVRRRQHIGVAHAGEVLEQPAQPLHAEHIVQPPDIQALRERVRQRRHPGGAARGQPGRDAENVGTPRVARGAREVGAGQQVAVRDLPLNPEIARSRRVQFDDERFDIDLRAACVELVDHRTQIAIDRVGRGDDERVRRGIGLNHAARLIVVAALTLFFAEKAAVAAAAEAGA